VEETKYTVSEAARILGVSPSLLYQLCQEQLIPHYRIGGKGRRGKILLSLADIEAFMQTCRVDVHPLMRN
jgi:excisionase family DNA binding protein